VGSGPSTTSYRYLGDSQHGQGDAPRLACLEPDLEQLPIAPNIRNHFSRIGVLGSGQLVLMGKLEQWFAVVRRDKRMLLEAIRPSPGSVRAVSEFADWRSRASFGFNLKTAAWSDGSRAVLDARGMLHLRSSGDVPETTLLLGDRQISGWCCDGRIWGQPFFCGEQSAVDDVAGIFHELIEAFAGRLPA
jgi:hypothetical protein